ncbi:uncharacterized protein LOC106166932 [Lingula anatina]|uniref:Uncharacterized protein LOC106166932 n=1 Tax=Lingula anatina TaxID=7574 RepID=A0A1S3ISJ7_LINAN|nr:uncharacterized protein LOC106166932 [Lingula anatina]|eukprot:XP_013401048.1 uncharacterized protein LOC106166932 [Lingula anatina]
MRGDAKRTLSTPVAIPEKHQFHHSHTVGEISTGNGTDDCGGNLSPTEAASDVNSNKPPQRRAPSLKYCSSKYLYSAQVQTDMARTSGGTSPNSPVSSGLYFPHSLSPIRSRANSENKKDWRPRDGDTSFSPNPRPRTWSMPAKHCRRRGQSADEPLPPAVCAIPEYAGNGQLQRVRSFTLSSKGLKNRGDSYKKKTTGSNQSMGQLDNFCSLVTEEEFRQRTSSVNSQGSLTHRSCGSGSSEFRPSYKVVIFGAGDVGRTSLTRQFMTSEYMGAFDASFGKKIPLWHLE